MPKINSNMSKLKEFFLSPHIQIALATGISIVVLAYVSKKILDEPMENLTLAIAPFIAMLYELLFNKHHDSKYLKPLYWIIAIFFVTALVILYYLFIKTL